MELQGELTPSFLGMGWLLSETSFVLSSSNTTLSAPRTEDVADSPSTRASKLWICSIKPTCRSSVVGKRQTLIIDFGYSNDLPSDSPDTMS